MYGLHFKEYIALDAGGPLTAQALNDGTIDVGLLFSSDPALRAGGLVDLRDDRDLQPSENVTPVVSQRALETFGPRARGRAERGLRAAPHVGPARDERGDGRRSPRPRT